MRIILQQDLKNLKQSILNQAAITVLTPSDCRYLSLLITKQTGKQVSDTTLKRIFGFANSIFQPSLYTLNLLSEYCGYLSWEDFCINYPVQQGECSTLKPVEIKDFTAYSRIITLNTLQALKKKSVVPFHLTIPREAVNAHLDLFFKSDKPITVLAAPAGYGKTVGLCHWAEKQLDDNRKDIFVLLSSKVLNRVTLHESLNNWLLALIGIQSPANFSSEVLNKHLAKQKFCLVIDEFDVGLFKPDEFELIFSMLLDVIAMYPGHPRFKVILTMRSATWAVVKRRLQLDNRLDDCFLWGTNEEKDDINVPMFNTAELKKLCLTTGAGICENEVNPEVLSLFSYPLFFQYYYQKHPADFCIGELNVFGTYEIVSSYILDKVYTARYSTEKIILIKSIIERGRFHDDGFRIDKIKVYDEIKTFMSAYQDLVSIGILREINQSTECGYVEYVEFVHQQILTYFLARNLIYDNEEQYDDRLIIKIANCINSHFRLRVLKWCIYNSIKKGKNAIRNHLHLIELTHIEKCYLNKFLISLPEPEYPLSDTNISDHLLPDQPVVS